MIVALAGLGRLRLRASAAGLRAVELDPRGIDPDDDHDHVRHAADELAAYADGALHTFTVRLDLSGLTPFRRRVLEQLRQVPYGATTTYGALADASGCPGGARAVGGAVGVNPVAIIIPCHRVLAAHGLGGFTGGLDWKRRLLQREGVACDG
jgi:methylated-DNA-[protein]-cysteine S-methyltransferase